MADVEWKLLCYECWFLTKAKRYENTKNNTIINRIENDLTLDNIKKLLFLCHPDKHNNSVISTEMTKFLLHKRKLIEKG